MQVVIDGKFDYIIVDLVVVSLFQCVYLELVVVFDIIDEQLVIWFSVWDDDNLLLVVMFDFFNNINEDGMLVCLEEKYFGYGNDFDYVDICIFLCVVENIFLEVQLLFEKYVCEIDWCLLVVIVWQEFYWDLQVIFFIGVCGMMMFICNMV